MAERGTSSRTTQEVSWNASIVSAQAAVEWRERSAPDRSRQLTRRRDIQSGQSHSALYIREDHPGHNQD